MAITGLFGFSQSIQAFNNANPIARTVSPAKVDATNASFHSRSDENRDRVRKIEGDVDSDKSPSSGAAVRPEGVGGALDVSA